MSHILKCDRTELTITHRCTLKCKLCGAYSPYYLPTPHWTFDKLKVYIDSYFNIVDYVEKFTISGGEPLLHPELSQIIEYMHKFSNQFNILEIITNGTIIPKEDVIGSFVRWNNRIRFIVDNYGTSLSTLAVQLSQLLTDYKIPHTLRKYHGDDAYFNGWIDMSDLSYRNRSENEISNVYDRCIFSKKFRRFLIVDGRVYICAVARRCDCLERIAENSKTEYIDLENRDISREEKREIFKHFFERDYFESCQYCNGFCDDYPRFLPGEQL